LFTHITGLVGGACVDTFYVTFIVVGIPSCPGVLERFTLLVDGVEVKPPHVAVSITWLFLEVTRSMDVLHSHKYE